MEQVEVEKTNSAYSATATRNAWIPRGVSGTLSDTQGLCWCGLLVSLGESNGPLDTIPGSVRNSTSPLSFFQYTSRRFIERVIEEAQTAVCEWRTEMIRYYGCSAASVDALACDTELISCCTYVDREEFAHWLLRCIKAMERLT